MEETKIAPEPCYTDTASLMQASTSPQPLTQPTPKQLSQQQLGPTATPATNGPTPIGAEIDDALAVPILEACEQHDDDAYVGSLRYTLSDNCSSNENSIMQDVAAARALVTAVTLQAAALAPLPTRNALYTRSKSEYINRVGPEHTPTDTLQSVDNVDLPRYAGSVSVKVSHEKTPLHAKSTNNIKSGSNDNNNNNTNNSEHHSRSIDINDEMTSRTSQSQSDATCQQQSTVELDLNAHEFMLNAVVWDLKEDVQHIFDTIPGIDVNYRSKINVRVKEFMWQSQWNYVLFVPVYHLTTTLSTCLDYTETTHSPLDGCEQR